MANLIIENKNSTSDPMYNPIFLKAGLAKIYKILNRTTCHVDDKFLMCFDGSLQPEDIPMKYSAKINIQYDLNWLGDQEGNIEEHCSNAFIQKITLTENFAFNECAEEHIDFDNLLLNVLDELEAAALIDTYDQVHNATAIVREFLTAPQKLVNTTNMKYMDESSGQYNWNRRVTHDLHQSTVISLAEDDAHVLDTFSVEMDKNDAFGQITLAIKSVTIEMLITEEAQNPENIDVSTECGTVGT